MCFNFAHGAMFMLGAYMGWQFYTNPTFLFGMLPLVLAFAAGITTTGLWMPSGDASGISRRPGRNACVPA